MNIIRQNKIYTIIDNIQKDIEPIWSKMLKEITMTNYFGIYLNDITKNIVNFLKDKYSEIESVSCVLDYDENQYVYRIRIDIMFYYFEEKITFKLEVR